MGTNTKISEEMTKHPISLSPEIKAVDALDLMRNYGVRHFPVVEKDKIVGLVSERDLAKLTNLEMKNELLVDHVMIRNPYKVKGATPLSKVCEQMYENKFGSAIVENDDGGLIGIFTMVDGMKLLSQLLKNPGDMEYDEFYMISQVTPKLKLAVG